MGISGLEEKENHHLVSYPIKSLRVANYDAALGGGGYQRVVDQNQVKRIAKNWDWSMVGLLTVSRRVGEPHPGELFVVDGQHRLEAGRMAFGEEQPLPCVVRPMTYEEEAARFARQSQNTRRVGARDLFHARIEARDPDAIEVKEVVERQGWVISSHKTPSGQNSIVAIATLVSIHRMYGATTLEETLRTLASAYGYHYEAVDNRILNGVAHFLYHFPVANRRELADKLGRPESIPRALQQNAARYGGYGSGKGGSMAMSRAIMDVYNKNRRQQNQLEWDLRKYRELIAN